jgi:hypothetical protein
VLNSYSYSIENPHTPLVLITAVDSPAWGEQPATETPNTFSSTSTTGDTKGSKRKQTSFVAEKSHATPDSPRSMRLRIACWCSPLGRAKLLLSRTPPTPMNHPLGRAKLPLSRSPPTPMNPLWEGEAPAEPNTSHTNESPAWEGEAPAEPVTSHTNESPLGGRSSR